MTRERKRELQSEYPGFVEFGEDYVVLRVDGELETFTAEDVKNGCNGYPMSGLRSFGPVSGDHRMISRIYEDVQTYFENEYPSQLE